MGRRARRRDATKPPSARCSTGPKATATSRSHVGAAPTASHGQLRQLVAALPARRMTNRRMREQPASPRREPAAARAAARPAPRPTRPRQRRRRLRLDPRERREDRRAHEHRRRARHHAVDAERARPQRSKDRAAEQFRSGLAQLERNMRELQESVMRVRMLPISFVFSRFPRMVRDLAQRLGKQVELTLTGERPSSTRPCWRRSATRSCTSCATASTTASRCRTCASRAASPPSARCTSTPAIAAATSPSK